MTVEQLGDGDLGGFEIDRLDLHHDIENAVRLRDAGAEGPVFFEVPLPARVLVVVVGVRAVDVRPAVAPGDAERVEDLGLVALDRGADRRRRDEPSATGVGAGCHRPPCR